MIDAGERRRLEREVESVGVGGDAPQKRRRILDSGDDGERRRHAARQDDGDGKVVDGSEQQFPQELEILGLEESRRRTFDVVVTHDATGSQTRLEHRRRDVERDDAIGTAQHAHRDDLANRIADDALGDRRDAVDVHHVERGEHGLAGLA